MAKSYVEQLPLIEIGIVSKIYRDPDTSLITADIQLPRVINGDVPAHLVGVELIQAGTQAAAASEPSVGSTVLCFRPYTAMYVASRGQPASAIYSELGWKALPVTVISNVSTFYHDGSGFGSKGAFPFKIGAAGACLGNLALSDDYVTYALGNLAVKYDTDTGEMWFQVDDDPRKLYVAYLDDATKSLFSKWNSLTDTDYEKPERDDPTLIELWQRIKEHKQDGTIVETLNEVDDSAEKNLEVLTRNPDSSWTRVITDADGNTIIFESEDATGNFSRVVTSAGGDPIHSLTIADTGDMELVVTDKCTLTIAADGTITLETEGDMNITAEGAVTIEAGGNFDLTGDLALDGNVEISGDLKVGGAGEVSGTFKASGTNLEVS